jgi:hypothetical protein
VISERVSEKLYGAIAAARTATAAQESEFSSLSGGKLHRRRSSCWLEKLGSSLEGLFPGGSPKAELRRANNGGEFLFDLIVHDSQNEWPFTGRRLWAVECEFAKRNKNVLRDFSKLLWADAENRLFICVDSKYLTIVRDMKSRIKVTHGHLFVCYMPHPVDWNSSKDGPFSLYKFQDYEWVGVKSQ